MKKLLIILILCGIISLSSYAQQRFYAIDGSEWVTEKDRDAREKLLWDEFYFYAEYIINKKLPEAELIETYSSMMDIFKEFFTTCREVNTGLKAVIEEGGEDLELLKAKIKIDHLTASNKEVLYARDLKTIFDLSLDQFDLISAFTKNVVNYNIGESDKMPMVDIERFTNNVTKITSAGPNFVNFMTDLREVVDNYKGEIILDILAKENQINRKKIYYSFDGREYKTLKGRDNYEQRLTQKYNKIFDLIKDDVKDSQDIETLRKVVFENIAFLKKVRTFNDILSFLEDEELRKKTKKEFPAIDLNPSTARNKEVCHIKTIYDIYDSLLGIFEIHASIMEYLETTHKENEKDRKKGGTTVMSLTINVDEHKDSRGVTHSELLKQITNATDNLSTLYPKLVDFYEKEKQRMK